jgi:hypothetical protein
VAGGWTHERAARVGGGSGAPCLSTVGTSSGMCAFPVRFHLAGHRDIGAAVYSVGGRVGRRQSLVATRQMLG